MTVTVGGAAELEAGYTVSFTLDSASLVTQGRVQVDGSDLRVAYWDGAAWLELDRGLVEMNTDHTQVWFKTEAAVQDEDDDYYLYYGNPLAVDPPDD
jgi:hypothetical protein